MALNFEEVSILGDLVNDTWGRSSTGEEEWQVGGLPNTFVTKSSLHNDKLIVTSLTIINLGAIGSQHQEIAKVENELNQLTKKYISNLKQNFKKKENAGRALKCKQIKDSERTDVEMINHYAATRRAYIRRSVTFEVL
jgi:hypothetical protein